MRHVRMNLNWYCEFDSISSLGTESVSTDTPNRKEAFSRGEILRGQIWGKRKALQNSQISKKEKKEKAESAHIFRSDANAVLHIGRR